MNNPMAGSEPAIQRRLRFPPPAPALRGVARAAHVMLGLVAFPFYWFAAAVRGVPGMRFRWQCFTAGLRLVFVPGHLADAYRCIVSPMDSVRHLEMDFFLARADEAMPARVLDVSSPRLFTLLLLLRNTRMTADFLNPDGSDLARTRSLAQALGVAGRCRFIGARIDALPVEAGAYPLVVCMSVLEHIVDDLDALRVMWSRVAPQGHLLLSVPCSAVGVDEYSNVDEYGLLEADGEGFVFWQRYYDIGRLYALYAIVGNPVLNVLYGERVAGIYDADVHAKRTDAGYPHWREPWATAKGYAYYDNVATLPGMGVIAMEFAKPPVDDR